MSSPSDSIAPRVWIPEIVIKLARAPQRFNRLLEIPGISDRILSQRLRELELDHLVVRDVDAGPPVRVHYRLTEKGQRLVIPYQLLRDALSEEREEVAAAS